jgi:hypothetical protein
MSIVIDKEADKIVIATGESNNRNPPSFSGAERHQDPLKFIEDFDKVARWNNWRSDGRKKETFTLCLTGHAERWATNHLMKDEELFKQLAFDEKTDDSILAKFKKEYITDDWYETYTKQYEDRVQHVVK